ncbi:hypothetical protein [Celeribacter sp.]|uniref:hypothetical protein n=1 Tax=Celeribacter sp. TaxID=1890673 RepID=UPI003A9479EB
MSTGTMKLVKKRLHAGVWEGEIHLPDGDTGEPTIEVTHRDQPVLGHTLAEDPDRAGIYFFRFAIPVDIISDGVEVFLFTDRETGERLGDCTLIAGEALAGDIRAEMALMREELDLLKRAFRRHCVDTGSA